MSRPAPRDDIRCKALARWTGNGRARCRNAAYGPSQLCRSHFRVKDRPPRPVSELIARLNVVDLGDGREIWIQLREREQSRYVSIRLFIGGVPTRRSINVPPGLLRDLVEGLAEAAEALES